jgi:hypothetical protein
MGIAGVVTTIPVRGSAVRSRARVLERAPNFAFGLPRRRSASSGDAPPIVSASRASATPERRLAYTPETIGGGVI